MSILQAAKRLVIGKSRDPLDPKVFHHLSLAAFLAWVGLGADGAPCNNNLDPWLEMRHAALVSAGTVGPGVLPAQEVLRMATIDGARVLAEKLRLLIADEQFTIDGVPVPLTISLGVATTVKAYSPMRPCSPSGSAVHGRGCPQTMRR